MPLKLLLSLVVLSLTFTAQASTETKEALALFEAGKYQDSLTIFRTQYKAKPDNTHLSYYLARNLYRLGNYDEADDVLEASLKRTPNHIDSLYLQGSVKIAQINDASVFSKLGLAKSGLYAWKKVVQLRPSHHEARYGLANFYLRAPSMAGGDLDLAEKEIKALDSIQPAWGQLVQAQLYHQDKDFSAAKPLYQAASQTIQDRAFPQFIYANFLFSQQDYKGAISQLEDYQARTRTWDDPGQVQIDYMFAQIYEAQGKLTEAKQKYQAALEAAALKSTQKNIRAALKKLNKKLT